MKKYFLTFIFVFGLFFLGLSTSTVNAADAGMDVQVSQADPYDSRKINLTFSNYDLDAEDIRVFELRMCEAGESGCETYKFAYNDEVNHSDKLMKVVYEETPYVVPETGKDDYDVITFTRQYTIRTQGDGKIYLLIRCFQGIDESGLPGEKANAYIVYTLSTLNQRVVVNPNGEGRPTHADENNVQYTAARNNSIQISLFEEEKEKYSGVVYACEFYLDKNNDCLKYTLSDTAFNYYLKSYGDGKKIINVYIILKDKEITGTTFNDSNSTLIVKEIILDTIGPKITIDGGQWIYVPVGKTYVEQNATCKDSVFPQDDCNVTNDLKVVRIDYNSPNYQLITYEASDRLGNITSLVVKVKVELPTNNNENLVPLVVSGLIMFVVVIILGIVVYKNHQKRKKLSYI